MNADRFTSFALRPAAGEWIAPPAPGAAAPGAVRTIEAGALPAAIYLHDDGALRLAAADAHPALLADAGQRELVGTMPAAPRVGADLLDAIGDRRTSFLAAFVETLFGGEALAIDADAIVANANQWIAQLPDAARDEVRLGAVLLEVVLGLDFCDLSVADRQARVQQRIAEPDLGLLRPLGRLRTVFYSSYFRDPRVWPSIGFVPPAQRPGAPARSTEDELTIGTLADEQQCDWLVIGSGAGGATAAAALAGRGKRVLVIDRGDYWPVKRLSHDDTGQYAHIYAGGGLQSSTSREIAVLQGQCVGGSSLINNCISFRLAEAGWSHPAAPDVLAQWQQAGIAIDRAGLAAAYAAVEHRLEVAEITPHQAGPNGRYLLAAWTAFRHGPHASAADRAAPFRLFRKNYGTGARTCWACGYCNSGCPYYRKNSVAQTFLADVVTAGSTIVAGAEATAIEFDDGDDTPAVARVQVRHAGDDKVVIPTEGVIVAAGVGASSALLDTSGIDNAGKRISCNLACPVIALMPARIDSWNGVQMASYVDRGDHLIESWFHPPATFCASMGGWFGEYLRRMKAYSRLTCLAALMPVTAMGEYRDGGFHLDLADDLLARLRGWVADIVRMHFAGGAVEVYLPSPRSITIRPGDDVDAIVAANLVQPHDVVLSTAHPQGGNVMAGSDRDGVVDADLKVFGTRNLYVADASIFPTSVRVNPQLTIMAMAHQRFAQPSL